jgi:putative FmdB family regulatory protein
MPIYEYQCSACGHEFEALQKMNDEPLTECPVCDETTLQKLISAAGFRLKGGGWYETDFKSGKKKNVHDTGAPKTCAGGACPATDTSKKSGTSGD